MLDRENTSNCEREMVLVGPRCRGHVEVTLLYKAVSYNVQT